MITLTKGYSGGFKDASEKEGIVTGYLNAFNVKDSDGDISLRGSFSKSITENGPNGKQRIKYLQDHDKTKGVGVFQVLQEDNFGLYYEAKIGKHTLGLDYIKMIEANIITEHSIGYQVVSQKYDQSAKVNNISEYKLYEGSGLQFWAANEYTPITGVKSETDLLQLMDSLEKALKSGTYSDETFNNIIIPKYNAVTEIIRGKSTEPGRLDETTLPGLEQIKEAFQKSFNL